MKFGSAIMNTEDQIVMTAFGIIGAICLGAAAGAPFWHGLAAGLVFTLAVIVYGKVTGKPQDTSTAAPQDYPLVEGFAEAILTIGTNGDIIYANPAAQDLLGPDTPSMAHTRAIRQPAVLAAIKDTLENGTSNTVVYQIETPVVRHMRTKTALIEIASGSQGEHRVLVVYYDITDLVIANTLRSDFLANASHELKTPIASILGYIETLRGHAKNDEEARNRFLIIMQQQAERMQRLITDILSLRHIELKEHNAPSDHGDLYLAAKAARESLTPLAKERGVKIVFKNKQELLVIGDQDELVQLVLNLLDNAVQMSPPGRKIILSFEAVAQWTPASAFSDEPIHPAAMRRKIVELPNIERGYGIVRIRDNGPGFAPEHLPRIGERFYRVIGDRKSGDKGTGLGLAVVKHITLRHRGGLFLESAKDKGTEFSILIPLAPRDLP